MKKMIFSLLVAMFFAMPLFAQPGGLFIPDKADLMAITDSTDALIKLKPDIKLKELDVFTKSLTKLQSTITKAKVKPISVGPQINQVMTAYKSLNKVIKVRPDLVKKTPELARYIQDISSYLGYMSKVNKWTPEEMEHQY